MFCEYFSCAGHSFHLIDINTKRLWLTIVFPIPSLIYVACLEHKVPPTVENTEIIQSGNTSLNNFKFVIYSNTRSKGIR